MKKYIDRDALADFANNQVGGITANHIMRFPTADVEPVKHGRWEHGECSVCGASPLDYVSGDMYVEVDYYPNYCPRCGSQNVDLWLDDDSAPNEDMRPDNESI